MMPFSPLLIIRIQVMVGFVQYGIEIIDVACFFFLFSSILLTRVGLLAEASNPTWLVTVEIYRFRLIHPEWD